MFLHKVNLHPAIWLSCWVKEPIIQYDAPNEFENYEFIISKVPGL